MGVAMQHEACRAIVSAADNMRSLPLPAQARELLAVIVRNANDAASEIDYLQTAVASFRPVPTCSLPTAYENLGLTRSERTIVECLVAAKGRPCSRNQIYNYLYASGPYKSNDYPEVKIVDVFISKVRSVLDKNNASIEAAGQPSVVMTHFGIGYSLEHLTEKNRKYKGRAIGRYMK